LPFLSIFELNSTLTVLNLWTFPYEHWAFPGILDAEHPFLGYIRTGNIISLAQPTVMAKASTAKSTQIAKAKLASTTSGQKMKENLIRKPSAGS
jgi:hypothetical protein